MLLISRKVIQRAKIILPMTVAASVFEAFFVCVSPDCNVAAIAAVLVSQTGQKLHADVQRCLDFSPESFIYNACWCSRSCFSKWEGRIIRIIVHYGEVYEVVRTQAIRRSKMFKSRTWRSFSCPIRNGQCEGSSCVRVAKGPRWHCLCLSCCRCV